MFDMRLPASDGRSMVAFSYARFEQVSQGNAKPGNSAESGTFVRTTPCATYNVGTSDHMATNCRAEHGTIDGRVRGWEIGDGEPLANSCKCPRHLDKAVQLYCSTVWVCASSSRRQSQAADSESHEGNGTADRCKP